MQPRDANHNTRARALAATLARIAVELDLLALEIEQTPEAVVNNWLFGMALHHLEGAVDAVVLAPETRCYRIADLVAA